MTARRTKRKSTDPICVDCRHYFVTWIEPTPHGCRFFGFRSQRVPSQVVSQESGIPCQSFDARPSPRTPRPRPTGGLDILT